ncbi:penicillin-binding transpeptidase domain-containing protein [Velocimicrobium porci]|uniref:Penicillin-binding protein n=1 Tax=Velocimicrobium porci TaxID=2606634 RepID=A0A6L5XZT9_9FIRM|nr:penicillin-binding transpeptidase domain-containing protein [Velocimicrobium porci]MSS64376.1 hypothetical protein [Velocimicrobium porci]
MFDSFMNWLKDVKKSRLFPISIIFFLLFSILIHQLFVLQIVNGEQYEKESEYRDEKPRELKSTRGNILDRKGKVLAYDELSYSVTIEDTGELETNEEKNRMIYDLIQLIEEHGDKLDTDFPIKLNENNEFEFTVEGNSLLRFKKDVYSLQASDKLSDEQISISAKEMFHYIRSSTEKSSPKFEIDDSYSEQDALKIMSIRYSLYLNRYHRYDPTTVAVNVSDKTVAAIKENSADLPGVEISQETYRVYKDSKYFAQMLGYTGTINAEELAALDSKERKKYTSTDQIGKKGLEKEYESYLHGEKGKETVVVNESKRVVGVKERVEPTAGNDLYLTIDADLQKQCYDILEKEIAGILLSQINNGMDVGSKGTSGADIKIPIYDVYFSLIDNNSIDISTLNDKDATNLEKKVYKKFQQEQKSVLNKLNTTLAHDYNKSNEASGKNMEEYLNYIYSMLIKKEILISDKIDREDKMYLDYADSKISLSKFLQYALSNNWIDLSKLEIGDEFYSTKELYGKLVDYMKELLLTDIEFSKKLYHTLIYNFELSGTDICLLLYDQGVLKYNEADINKLKSGNISAYNFIRDKIKKLEITPAQLALEPCSGSIVVTDPNTGEVRALVSYPGYDNNKLANSVDAKYYSYLESNSSAPMLNRPLQSASAPGSTFKMLTSVVALEEGVVTPTEKILDKHQFTKIDANNGPKCWSGSSHGKIDISDAIQVSCNYFFYEMGYRLSLDNGEYNSKKGLARIRKYAKMFGLDSKSGIELYEYKPNISTEDSVRSAIGQGNNNYTPAEIARYVTTVANRGTCYDLTIVDKVKDLDGNVLLNNKAKVHNQVNIKDSTWDAVHSGTYKVVNGPRSSISSLFSKLNVKVAGKTGTAQESKSKPNHALFVSFAPYEDPEISVSVVIQNGYTSSNAAEVARNVYKYYFKSDSDEKNEKEKEEGVNTPELGTQTYTD